MQQFTYRGEDDRFHLELAQDIRLEIAGFVNCPIGWAGETHSHPFWELVFFNSGKGELHFGKEVWPVEKNELVMIPPMEAHQFINTGSEKVENMYVGFAFDVKPVLESGFDSGRPLKLEPLDLPLIDSFRGLFEVFLHSGKRGASQTQAAIFDCIYKTLDYIQAHPEISRVFMVDRNEIVAEKAKKYLEEHIHCTIQLEEVAGKFFLSPNYFSKRFKAVTGFGVKEYHNQARMLKALDFLRNPQLSISDISAKLGFSYVNYFSNKFREFHHQSPTEYRRKWQQERAGARTAASPDSNP